MQRVYDSAVALLWALAAPLFSAAADEVKDVPVDGACSGRGSGSPVVAMCRIMMQCSQMDSCWDQLTKLRRLARLGIQH